MDFGEFHNAIRVLYCIDYGEFKQCLVGFYDEPEWLGQWEKFTRDPHRYFVSVSDGLAQKLFAIIEARNAKRRAA